MEKYDLGSEPCDYRLIRINNCLQMLACLCSILAIIDSSFSALANLINNIADLFYHIVSGCMTAQVFLSSLLIIIIIIATIIMIIINMSTISPK
jgi:hypothetical protein